MTVAVDAGSASGGPIGSTERAVVETTLGTPAGVAGPGVGVGPGSVAVATAVVDDVRAVEGPPRDSWPLVEVETDPDSCAR